MCTCEAFVAQNQIFSAQVRLWDVPTGTNVETLNHTKAVHAVAVAPDGGGPVAFGGAEGALRLWDPRAPKGDDLVGCRLSESFSFAGLILNLAVAPGGGGPVGIGGAEGVLRLWNSQAPKGDDLVRICLRIKPVLLVCVGMPAGRRFCHRLAALSY